MKEIIGSLFLVWFLASISGGFGSYRSDKERGNRDCEACFVGQEAVQNCKNGFYQVHSPHRVNPECK